MSPRSETKQKSALKKINFADQEKLDLAQYFIKSYLSSRQGLTRLGILRSERNLQGDYAEWLVSKLFGLQLTDSTVEKGFDAVDSRGRKYQVKSRVVKDLQRNTSFDIADIENQFDFLVGVFFSQDFQLLGIIKVPYDIVKELGSQTTKRFSFRWSKKVAEDDRIEKLLWEEHLAGS